MESKNLCFLLFQNHLKPVILPYFACHFFLFFLTLAVWSCLCTDADRVMGVLLLLTKKKLWWNLMNISQSRQQTNPLHNTIICPIHWDLFFPRSVQWSCRSYRNNQKLFPSLVFLNKLVLPYFYINV